MATIEAAHRGGVVRAASVDRVIVDTTVMPKAIAHPTDSRLLEKSRQQLVAVAENTAWPCVRTTTARPPGLAAQIGRYAHAKQFKRMRKAVRTLRTRVGRVQREVARQLDRVPEQAKAKVSDLLARTGRILTQRTKDKNKLYALHAPEVECISKGQGLNPLRVRCEGEHRNDLEGGLVVGMRSMSGNPYDSHTLAETREQVGILADCRPTAAIVDRGYRGVEMAHPALGTEVGYHADLEGDDPSAQRHRAGHRAHEDGRQARAQPAQGCVGRRAACGDVRCGAQPEDDRGEAAASLRPVRDCPL